MHFACLANKVLKTKKVHETITFLLVTYIYRFRKKSLTDSAINLSPLFGPPYVAVGLGYGTRIQSAVVRLHDAQYFPVFGRLTGLSNPPVELSRLKHSCKAYTC